MNFQESKEGAQQAMKPIEGVITALVTPFTRDGAVDVAALRASVRHQVASGSGGLCPLGGTGEPLSLSVAEHKLVIDTVVEENAGRLPVVIGTLLGSQADIVECARHARLAGADAVMVIPPYFVVAKPPHIRQHFDAIAQRAEIALVLFHGPARSGLRLDADTILQLIEAVPSIVAIKETSGDLTIAAELLRSAPPGFRVLQGFDEYVLPTLALGGHGAVLSLGCLVPNLLRRLREAFEAHRLAEAQRIQLDLLPLCRVIYGEPNPGPLQLALEMAGRPAGPTRPPIYAPSADTQAALRTLLPPILQAEAAATRA
jgi:4-hydroxy-tetrahydrodipicolinate synthase